MASRTYRSYHWWHSFNAIEVIGSVNTIASFNAIKDIESEDQSDNEAVGHIEKWIVKIRIQILFHTIIHCTWTSYNKRTLLANTYIYISFLFFIPTNYLYILIINMKWDHTGSRLNQYRRDQILFNLNLVLCAFFGVVWISFCIITLVYLWVICCMVVLFLQDSKASYQSSTSVTR